MAKSNLLNGNRAAEARLQNVAIDRVALAVMPSFGKAIALQMRKAADDFGRGSAIAGAVLSNSEQLVNAYVNAYKRSSMLVAPRIMETGKRLHGRDIIVKADEGDFPIVSYWNIAVSKWVERNAAYRVTQVNQATINQLQRIITLGQQEGLTTLAIQKSILKSIKTLTPIRARAIARTEVHAGSQATSLAAAELIQVDTLKEWNAVEDSRTREDHSEADGQTVGLPASFEVGGANMMHPGDPSAPVEQVINCRCVMDYPVV